MTFHSLLLAQVMKSTKLEKIAHGFQFEKAKPTELPGFQGFIAALGLVFVLLVFVLWWSQRGHRKAARFTPFQLFAHVVRDMDIGLPDRILLRWVARSSELDQPVVLLFSPALLDQQISAWTERPSLRPMRRFLRSRLNAVMDKVFVEE